MGYLPFKFQIWYRFVNFRELFMTKSSYRIWDIDTIDAVCTTYIVRLLYLYLNWYCRKSEVNETMYKTNDTQYKVSLNCVVLMRFTRIL